MSVPEPMLLARREWSIGELLAAHPTAWTNENKRAVAEHLAGIHGAPEGDIAVSRWEANALPSLVPDHADSVAGSACPGFFDYRGDASSWWLNFADVNLFGYADGPLLAQDELQCLETPSLLNVRDAMRAQSSVDSGLRPQTARSGKATPVLVHGAPRLATLRTTPTATLPSGLYGNNFARADRAHVLAAIDALPAPAPINVLAIAAPPWGEGAYTRGQIIEVLMTAYAGFRAAELESAGNVVINTGWWGCGAFGGDRVFMGAAQVIAARLAGVSRIVLWTAVPEDPDSAKQAIEIAVAESPVGRPVSEVIDGLCARGFIWGVGNGS